MCLGKKCVNGDDVMRERESRGNGEVHFAAFFDYLEKTFKASSEGHEKEKRK